MKKFIPIVILVIAGIIWAAVACTSQTEDDFIRIHIRANSNQSIDQEIKYKIRNSIVTALTPAADNVKNKDEMMVFIENNLKLVERIANDRLKEANLPYNATAKLVKEEFPARTYNGVTLDAGVYDSLIVELGEAEGNNWWCVVYPKLCFVPQEMTDEKDFYYESIIWNLISKGKVINSNYYY